ncbi:MAG TPA: hypothetical protein VFU49_15530, partial [Ktedonobacteraceae bacterium]|nr:hypothetical protein [Ktedonobacteraceae bacterium]
YRVRFIAVPPPETVPPTRASARPPPISSPPLAPTASGRTWQGSRSDLTVGHHAMLGQRA